MCGGFICGLCVGLYSAYLMCFIFRTLKRFFGYLEQDLGGVIVSDKNDMRLAQMIGKKTGDQLVDMIVKECLTPAVPYSAEEKPYFEELLTTADNFHEYLTVGCWCYNFLYL